MVGHRVVASQERLRQQVANRFETLPATGWRCTKRGEPKLPIQKRQRRYHLNRLSLRKKSCPLRQTTCSRQNIFPLAKNRGPKLTAVACAICVPDRGRRWCCCTDCWDIRSPGDSSSNLFPATRPFTVSTCWAPDSPIALRAWMQPCGVPPTAYFDFWTKSAYSAAIYWAHPAVA